MGFWVDFGAIRVGLEVFFLCFEFLNYKFFFFLMLHDCAVFFFFCRFSGHGWQTVAVDRLFGFFYMYFFLKVLFMSLVAVVVDLFANVKDFFFFFCHFVGVLELTTVVLSCLFRRCAIIVSVVNCHHH
jgi:hypothetical protein